MANTSLLLDLTDWDLVVDAARNIAVCTEPYRLGQDAATAIKLFEGELWYDTAKGVPYWAQILGHSSPMPLAKAKFQDAALTAKGVASAQVFINSVKDRILTGQVQVSDGAGLTAVAGF